MAYLAEIQLAVKGARQLKDLSDAIESTSKRVDRLARDIQTLSEAGIPRTINNLRNLVNDAADAFNKAALGTDEATAAAKKYVKATDELNAGLRERSALLEKITRQERAAAMVRAGVSMPAPQLLLPAARQGAPTMSGGARRRITGPVERLGGARTADEAAMALRFAQALQQQTRPLSQIESIYAGIAGEAAKLQSIKALPDTAMLNASARGIKQLQTAENMLNTERQESVARLEQIDRLEAGRERRARKLQERQQYMTGEPATSPTSGADLRGRAGGAISSAIIGGGFPLLFGQGAAAAVGGGLGGLAGGLVGGGFGFALSIAGTALGDAADKADTFNRQLAALNSQVVGTGNTLKLTSKDVDNLANALGIAKDEALKVLQTFAGFGDAKVTKGLAFLYGDDASIIRNLAAAQDQADIAQVILGAYEKIGVERASQLINQLKLGDSAAVELAFQKALLDAKVKQTEEGLKQIRIQDYIIAGLATAASFAGGGQGQIVDPAIFGQQRVEEFRQKNRPSDIFTGALKGLNQLRAATRGVEALRPDKGAEKAAQKAAEEAKRVAEVVRDRTAETELLQVQQQLQTRIFNAEQNKDTMLVARLKGEQEILDIQFKYAQELAKEPSILAQQAIVKKGLQEIDNARVKTAQELQALENARAEAVNNMLQDMDLEIIKTQAKTDAQKQAAQIMEIELQFLRQGKQLTTDEVAAIALKIAELEKAKKLQAETTALLQVETQLFDSLASNVASAFSSAITSAVQGTEDLGTALQNVGTQLLGTIGNMLIMYGIAQALGAAGGGVGNPQGILSFLARGFGFAKAADGAYWSGGFQAFADGGMVTRPTMGLVGEGGEAEYIIPASKMRGAMNRYAAGARGSAVIPAGDGGDGGTATMVAAPGAIDVRYTVERINSVDYVTADQFQQGMQQAAQQGAAQGEQRTLRRLQMSTSTRKRLGM